MQLFTLFYVKLYELSTKQDHFTAGTSIKKKFERSTLNNECLKLKILKQILSACLSCTDMTDYSGIILCSFNILFRNNLA